MRGAAAAASDGGGGVQLRPGCRVLWFSRFTAVRGEGTAWVSVGGVPLTPVTADEQEEMRLSSDGELSAWLVGGVEGASPDDQRTAGGLSVIRLARESEAIPSSSP